MGRQNWSGARRCMRRFPNWLGCGSSTHSLLATLHRRSWPRCSTCRRTCWPTICDLGISTIDHPNTVGGRQAPHVPAVGARYPRRAHPATTALRGAGAVRVYRELDPLPAGRGAVAARQPAARGVGRHSPGGADRSRCDRRRRAPSAAAAPSAAPCDRRCPSRQRLGDHSVRPTPTRSSGSEPTCTGRWRIRFGSARRLHSIGPMTSWPGESTMSRPVSDPRLEPVPEEASAMTQIYHRLTSPSTKSSRSRLPPPGSNATSTARSTPKPSNGSCTPPTTSSPAMPPSPTSCPSSPNASRDNASTPWPRSRADPTTASRPCCSCARTTPADPRWQWASSSTTPAAPPSPGPAARNPATGSTRPPSQR